MGIATEGSGSLSCQGKGKGNGAEIGGVETIVESGRAGHS